MSYIKPRSATKIKWNKSKSTSYRTFPTCSWFNFFDLFTQCIKVFGKRKLLFNHHVVSKFQLVNTWSLFAPKWLYKLTLWHQQSNWVQYELEYGILSDSWLDLIWLFQATLLIFQYLMIHLHYHRFPQMLQYSISYRLNTLSLFSFYPTLPCRINLYQMH